MAGRKKPALALAVWLLLSSLIFPAETLPVSAAVAGPGPALTVNVANNRYPISPDIYGLNFASQTLSQDLDLTVNRSGGNLTTRYNWQLDVYNHSLDYYFQNIPEDVANVAALPDGSSTDQFVEQNKANGVRSLLTVPMIGRVPNTRAGKTCSYSVQIYGAQQATDPYFPDCGNGLKPDGVTRINNNPDDASSAVTPAFWKGWIQHLVNKYGSAIQGGVKYYSLDNEPELWNEQHRDVWKTPLTYDQLRDLSLQYAAVIKQVDSSAKVIGPVPFGWWAYFYSALDLVNYGYTDFNSHGKVPIIPWYLQQMKAYEQQNGVRLLDYLDLHFYPQNGTSFVENDTDPNRQALRLRSTRSLWDATYPQENSWVYDVAAPGETGPGITKIIPRMRDWAAQNYPGTKLSISEYNWGALDSLNGTLAQADILGIFGRERLDMAMLWSNDITNLPAAFAFKMYRNYDGQHRRFGDISVQASSANQDNLSVYAAQRSNDNALTLMIINKTANDLTSSVALSGFNPSSTATVYRYSAANLTAIVPQANQTINGNSFNATFPANSITLVVIPDSQTLTVFLNSDNSPSNTPGTLSYALNNWTPSKRIGFNLPGNNQVIQVTGTLPNFPTGVTVDGGDCNNVSPVVVDGTGVTNGKISLAQSVTLRNLIFKKWQLQVWPGGTKSFSCVAVRQT